MGVTKLTTNSFTGLEKYDSFLAGNGPVLGGAFESIATTTVGSGGTTTVTFSSLGTGFTHLQLRIMARANTEGGANSWGLSVRFNNDSAGNYSSHQLYGTGSTAAAGGSASQTEIVAGNYPQSAATTNAYGVMVIDILDAFNTSKYKTLRSLNGYDGNDTNGILTYRSGAWLSTTAINRIDLIPHATFAQYSSFALYGVKA